MTRSDFDGLVCAMLLRELNLINEIKFVHPKDMQDGAVQITARDITTNLPYVPGCHLAFDHHSSEEERNGSAAGNQVISIKAASAARVVYDHFGGRKAFPHVPDDLMCAVDKADSAQYTKDEILAPSGWTLLSFLMDPRTGLGRFRQFRISNYDLMMTLIEQCRGLSIEQVLELPDVKERVELYFEHESQSREQLQRCATFHGDLVVLDLRDEETIYAGNRFVIYALIPPSRVSMHVRWALKQQNTVFAIGKSILDRSSPVDIGSLCLSHGGGGHKAAGTCQVENARADAVKVELMEKITSLAFGKRSELSGRAA